MSKGKDNKSRGILQIKSNDNKQLAISKQSILTLKTNNKQHLSS